MDRIESIDLGGGVFAGIYHDDGPEDPWTAWDGNPPGYRFSARHLRALGDPPTPSALADRIPARFFRKRSRQDDVLDAIGADRGDFESMRRNFAGRSDERAKNALLEVIGRGWAGNLRSPDLGGCDAYFSALEALSDAAGIVTYRTTSQGHSQSDWAELIFFALPEDGGERWSPGDPEGSLKASAELWGFWAWGDVYGYVLEDEHGEELYLPQGGSCWGFYGQDHGKSGLLDQARSEADYYRREVAEEVAEREYWEARDVCTAG